jgi:hypothetical protein
VLPAGGNGQRGPEFEAFTVIEVLSQPLVGGRVDDRVWDTQEIDQEVVKLSTRTEIPAYFEAAPTALLGDRSEKYVKIIVRVLNLTMSH